MSVPTNNSNKSQKQTAYYLGLSSLVTGALAILCSCFAGIPAIVLGTICLRNSEATPADRRMAWGGIALGIMFSVFSMLAFQTLSDQEEPSERSTGFASSDSEKRKEAGSLRNISAADISTTRHPVQNTHIFDRETLEELRNLFLDIGPEARPKIPAPQVSITAPEREALVAEMDEMVANWLNDKSDPFRVYGTPSQELEMTKAGVESMIAPYRNILSPPFHVIEANTEGLPEQIREHLDYMATVGKKLAWERVNLKQRQWRLEKDVEYWLDLERSALHKLVDDLENPPSPWSRYPWVDDVLSLRKYSVTEYDLGESIEKLRSILEFAILRSNGKLEFQSNYDSALNVNDWMWENYDLSRMRSIITYYDAQERARERFLQDALEQYNQALEREQAERESELANIRKMKNPLQAIDSMQTALAVYPPAYASWSSILQLKNLNEMKGQIVLLNPANAFQPLGPGEVLLSYTRSDDYLKFWAKAKDSQFSDFGFSENHTYMVLGRAQGLVTYRGGLGNSNQAMALDIIYVSY